VRAGHLQLAGGSAPLVYGLTLVGTTRSANSRRGTAAIVTACGCLLFAGVPAARATPDAIPGVPATAAPAPTAPTATPAPPAEPSSGATSSAVVQQPRPFGYVLGDTLTQRVLLRSVGQEFEPVAFPPAERAGLWFARRSSKIERAEDGRRWLVIDYQLVNAPQTLMTVNLPAVTLKSKAGSTLAVPEWPISVAPLTPRAAFAKGGLQDLRLDHAAPTLPTLKLQWQLEIWLSAFALTVVSWFGWWLVRSLSAAANQPFASALREICRAGDDSAATAWLALHRAFDRTAGRALQTTTLPVLFKRAPHFEPQRTAIERFYAESNVRFFGVAPGGVNASPSVSPLVSLRALATTLRRIEKQHER
jgi:mxaA protein